MLLQHQEGACQISLNAAVSDSTSFFHVQQQKSGATTALLLQRTPCIPLSSNTLQWNSRPTALSFNDICLWSWAPGALAASDVRLFWSNWLGESKAHTANRRELVYVIGGRNWRNAHFRHLQTCYFCKYWSSSFHCRWPGRGEYGCRHKYQTKNVDPARTAPPPPQHHHQQQQRQQPAARLAAEKTAKMLTWCEICLALEWVPPPLQLLPQPPSPECSKVVPRSKCWWENRRIWDLRKA